MFGILKEKKVGKSFQNGNMELLNNQKWRDEWMIKYFIESKCTTEYFYKVNCQQ